MNNLEQEILNLIDKYFGQPEVYMWSTYILPNGNFLSPYNILEEYPDLEYEFTYEHSDFTDLLTYYTKDGEEVRWRDIFKALNKHTIKMNVTYPYLYLPEERITSEQLRAIKNILTNYSKGFTTHKDIWDYGGLLIVAPKGEKLYTTEELLFVEDVIKDIQMFYRTGFLESQRNTQIINTVSDPQTLKTVEYKGFKIDIPNNLTLYHGTASENEESIKLHGLDPIYSDYVDDYIWLETDYYTAVNWGKRHSNQGASVYAIDVKNLDINLLDIDYYNYEYFDDIIDEYGYLEITDITFIYKGKIPPEVLYLIE